MIDHRRLIRGIEDFKALDTVASPVAGWVQAATNRGSVKNALSGTWLGHPLHPMATDIPIGAWTMASVLDFTAGESGARAARRLVALGVLAAVPAASSGASDWSDSYGAEQRIGLVHAVANTAGTLLQAASWLARRRGCRKTGILFSAAGLGATLGAGYLGGYLSFALGVGVNRTAFQERSDEWTDVAASHDLAEDEPARAWSGDVPVVLIRHAGAIHALSATCVHAGGPLDEGAISDGCVRCPWHSSEFRLTDGHPVRGPATMDQPRWQVKTEDGRVFVRADRTPSA